MRVLIMGCGRVGSELSHALGAAGHDVTVIDKRPEAFDHYPPGDHARRIVGLGFDRDVLEEAGIREADAFIAVSSGDNSNIVSARVALEHYHVPKVIARIFDPRRAEIYERLNIPTVATTTWGVKQVQLMLLHTDKEVRESLGGGQLLRVRIPVPAHLVGKPVTSLNVDGHILVAGVSRGGKGFVPAAEFHDARGGLPDRHDREGLHGRTGRIARSSVGASLMKVLVTGGGAIGRHVAADLVVRGHEVTLIEQDPATVEDLRQEIPEVSVMLGDACEPWVLDDADLAHADVVVAATGDDEDNLVTALLAKQEFAVPRVLARVNHPKNEWLFTDQWGVDTAVSPPHMLTSMVEEAVTSGDLVQLLRLEGGRDLDRRDEARGRLARGRQAALRAAAAERLGDRRDPARRARRDPPTRDGVRSRRRARRARQLRRRHALRAAIVGG